jgi:hypothetical protein
MARTTSTPQKSRRCLPSSSYLFTTLLIRWLEELNRSQLDFVRKSNTVGQQSINMAFSDEIPGKAASLLTVVIEQPAMNSSTLTDGWHRAFKIDPPIKQEASYSVTSGSSQAITAPKSLSQKRRRPDQSQELGEKRQRIASGSSASRPAEPLSVKFREMLAQTEGAVMQQHAPSANRLQIYQEQAESSCPAGAQHEHIEPEGRSRGFMSDPHLYMRILSLPILESLVGTAFSDSPKLSNHCTVYPNPVNPYPGALACDFKSRTGASIRARPSIYYSEVAFRSDQANILPK